MKSWIAVPLLACAALAHAQGTTAPAASAPASAPASAAKKALVARVLQMQQPGMESLARQIAERPVRQLLQDAQRAMQQVPPEKREGVAKTVEADARKFYEEAVPVIRERAVQLAPTTIGAMLEERFSEDELRQIAAWLESPVQRKYVQLAPEMDRSLMQQLSNEIAPLLDPKLQALQQKTRATFGMPPAGGAASAPAASASPASPSAASPSLASPPSAASPGASAAPPAAR